MVVSGYSSTDCGANTNITIQWQIYLPFGEYYPCTCCPFLKLCMPPFGKQHFEFKDHMASTSMNT